MKRPKTLTKLLVASLAMTISASILTGCSPELAQALLANANQVKEKSNDKVTNKKDKAKDLLDEEDNNQEENEMNEHPPKDEHADENPPKDEHADEHPPEDEHTDENPPKDEHADEQPPEENPEHVPCAVGQLKIRFGQFAANPDVPHETKWPGMLKIDNGKVRLVQLVRFESHDNLKPISPHELAWEAYTQPHFDGFIAELMAAPEGPEPMIKVDTGHGIYEYHLGQLAGLHELKTIDDMGNQVEIAGEMLPPVADQCHQFDDFEHIPPKPPEENPPEDGTQPPAGDTTQPPAGTNTTQPPAGSCGKYVPKADGSLDVSRPDGSQRTLQKGEYELINNDTQVKILKAGEPDTGAVVTAPPCDGTTQPPAGTTTPTQPPAGSCGKYVPKADGSLDVSRPDGSQRTLQKGEYELLNNDTQVKILKAGEPDTGAVVTAPACPS